VKRAINREPVIEEEWPYDDELSFRLIPVPDGRRTSDVLRSGIRPGFRGYCNCRAGTSRRDHRPQQRAVRGGGGDAGERWM